MGAQPSKLPVSPYQTEPLSKVEFGSSEDTLQTVRDATQTEFIKNEDKEKHIEELVSKRLVEMERAALEKFEDKLNSSLLLVDTAEDKLLSSRAVDEKIDGLQLKLDLFKSIREEKEARFARFEKDGLKEKLVQCLLDNKGKPLNCYDYIEHFKHAVAKTYEWNDIEKRKEKTEKEWGC